MGRALAQSQYGFVQRNIRRSVHDLAASVLVEPGRAMAGQAVLPGARQG